MRLSAPPPVCHRRWTLGAYQVFREDVKRSDDPTRPAEANLLGADDGVHGVDRLVELALLIQDQVVELVHARHLAAGGVDATADGGLIVLAAQADAPLQVGEAGCAEEDG